jgi:GTP-binding protein HflX
MIKPENNHTPCVLFGININKKDYEYDVYSLDELGLLAETAGFSPKGKHVFKRDRIDPAYYVGRAKAQEIRRTAVQDSAEAVIFDFELTPVQTRNLERLIKSRIISRTELILTIFERRARTKEAQLQVELATLLYSLPKLRHLWPHLNRIAGGFATKGPGEKQLEMDKRTIQKRISKIKKELEAVQTHRKVIRKNRKDKPKVALVGYTNAGKSSLLNTLSHSSLFTENRLFATLDPATREVWLGDGVKAMVTDTVGFIKRLPHTLIASFRATLAEVKEGDILLHVVDISSSDAEERIKAVKEVLREISADRLPVFYVFNKVDLLSSRDSKASLLHRYRDNAVVSAITGEGIEELKKYLYDFFTALKVNHAPYEYAEYTW